MKTPIIMGHRANSLRRLVRYVMEDIDAIEFDVYYEPVHTRYIVRHPKNDRFELNPGNISRNTWVSNLFTSLYLKGYIKFSDFMLILSKYLSNKIRYIMIDLKNYMDVEGFIDIINRYASDFEIYISTKIHPLLSEISDQPRISKLATISERLYEPARYLESLGVDGVSLEYQYAENDYLSDLKDNGYLVALWTVNNSIEISHIDLPYPDIIVSDVPWRLRWDLDYINRK